MSSNRYAIWLVLLAALAIRSAAMLAQADSVTADPDGYRSIAELLLRAGEYRRPVDYEVSDQASDSIVTAYRPPLYPLALAAIGWRGEVSDIAIGVLHVLLGTATVGLTYLLAIRWLSKELERVYLWSALAAMLVALDPILLRQASVVMTETLATFLAVLALLLLTWHTERRHWVTAALAGAVIGLACLCRPTFLPWMALIAIALPWGRFATCQTNETNGRLQTCPTLAFLAASILILLPWTVRNYGHFGKPIIATTHGGYTLLLANNPEFYRYLHEAELGELFDAEGSQMGRDYRRMQREYGGDELAVDRWASARARQHIADAPLDFAYASLVRTGRFWQLMPNRTRRTDIPVRHPPSLWEGRLRSRRGGQTLDSASELERSVIESSSNKNSDMVNHAPRQPSPPPSSATLPEGGWDDGDRRTGMSVVHVGSESTLRYFLRLAIGVWYGAVFAAAVVGMIGLRGELIRAPWLWGLLLAVSLTAVHAVYWSNMRMRAPLVPVVSVFAVAGVRWLVERRRAAA